MFNLKYEIKINDETGRPYVSFPNQVDHPEHKFMALEIVRYLLNGLLKDNEQFQELTQETEIEIARAGYTLEQISNEVGRIIIEQNKVLGDLGLEIKTDDDGQD